MDQSLEISTHKRKGFDFGGLRLNSQEFLWRGVMLPRQEIAFGKKAWIIHDFGWGLFHIAFGWQLLIT
jgi:hypothetical protein